MDKALIAEMVLRLVCGRKRSAEIVGDLLEKGTTEQESLLRLASMVFIAFAWRWMAGFVVSAVCSLIALARCGTHLQTYSGATLGTLHWGFFSCLGATCISSVVIIHAIRYEVRSRITVVGTILAVLLLTMAWCAVYPLAPLITAVGVLVCSAACLSTRALRAAYLVLAASAVAYAGAFYMLMRLINISSRSPLVIGTQFFVYWFFALTIGAIVLAYTRRLFRSTMSIE